MIRNAGTFMLKPLIIRRIGHCGSIAGNEVLSMYKEMKLYVNMCVCMCACMCVCVTVCVLLSIFIHPLQCCKPLGNRERSGPIIRENRLWNPFPLPSLLVEVHESGPRRGGGSRLVVACPDHQSGGRIRGPVALRAYPRSSTANSASRERQC